MNPNQTRTDDARDPAADFVVTHAKDAQFDGGLRGFFEYRDLGMKPVTDGRIQAHVIRAKPGDAGFRRMALPRARLPDGLCAQGLGAVRI